MGTLEDYALFWLYLAPIFCRHTWGLTMRMVTLARQTMVSFDLSYEQRQTIELAILDALSWRFLNRPFAFFCLF